METALGVSANARGPRSRRIVDQQVIFITARGTYHRRRSISAFSDTETELSSALCLQDNAVT